MDNEILISQTGNITESLTTGDCVRPGCLGQLKGPIADWKDSTRNQRYYSRELWVKVFNTDWVKEALETRTLFGEADHPETRIEPLLTQAAVVLVDYRFVEDESAVYGTFDILDTPSGRILRTLADYGCELGVSSRGRGSLINKNGRQEVDPDSYVFGGFDVVALPAVKKARQVFVKESKDFRLDIVDQIKMCESESDLQIIKNVLDTANLSDISRIDQLIETRMSEFHNSEDDTIIDGLTRDLREACNQIESLKKKLDRVESQGIVDTIDESELIEHLRDILQDAGEDDTINEGRIAGKIENIIQAKDQEIASLKESQLSEEIESELQENQQLLESMSGELESKDQELDNMSSVVNKLREALDESKESLAESQKELASSREELVSLNTELEAILTEYNDVVDGYNSLLAKNQELTERYLNEQAMRLGISRNDLVRLLPEEYDVSDIDDIVDSQLSLRRKINKLPMSSSDFSLHDSYMNESYLARTYDDSSSNSLDTTKKILLSMKKDQYNEKQTTANE